MPIIGAITGGSTSPTISRAPSKSVTATNLADAKKQGAVLAWGNFLTLTINSIIIAFVLFIVIRAMNKFKRKEEAAPAAPPKPTRQEELLTDTAISSRRANVAEKKERPIKVAAENRKARFNYAIEDTIEAGISLTGTEIKSIRNGKSTIAESTPISKMARSG